MKKGRKQQSIKSILDIWVRKYNHPSFIESDPIAIPHRFSKREDIEISGLFAALLAWGQRKTILNKCTDLLARMDNAPHDFIRSASAIELQQLEGFVHRTFISTDLLYFVDFLREWYATHPSLEEAFAFRHKGALGMEQRLIAFHMRVFSLPHHLKRTRKHLSSPGSGSACKRINMYLRWMVRKDNAGVDFGIWQTIGMHELICPLDLHSGRVARALGLLKRNQDDWTAAIELTDNLRKLDKQDPVKYDFALFGAGVNDLLLPVNKPFV